MNYYHVVDHDGFGTMHKLIGALCYKYNNHILLDRNDTLKNFFEYKNSILVIHTSGGGNPKVLYMIEKNKNINIFIFIHTSYNYQKYKKRDKLLNILKKYSSLKNVKILVPSDEVAKQYKEHGIICHVVQLGIKTIDKNKLEYKKELSKYYDKIITTCSSYKNDYKYIKGIDLFEKFIKSNNLIDDALILGINDNAEIISKELSEDDFINVLFHSKLYLQFSRMESYNLTAVQAKQLKIPVILLQAEGNYNCMNGYVYNSIEQTEQAALSVLKNKFDKTIVNMLYNDSISRESLENFKKSLEVVEYENSKEST